MTKRVTRRKILSMAGAAGGIAILPVGEIEAAEEAEEGLHTEMHDLGVFNNTESRKQVQIRLSSKTNEEVSKHGENLFELTQTLPGINQSQAVTASDARSIAAITTPGRGWYKMTVEVDGQTASRDVLLDRTGVVDYGSIGVYVDPDGTPAVRWSMS